MVNSQHFNTFQHRHTHTHTYTQTHPHAPTHPRTHAPRHPRTHARTHVRTRRRRVGVWSKNIEGQTSAQTVTTSHLEIRNPWIMGELVLRAPQVSSLHTSPRNLRLQSLPGSLASSSPPWEVAHKTMEANEWKTAIGLNGQPTEKVRH